MFEKFSNSDVDSAGRGGEYTVQAGFGWTNGVVLWAASNYGHLLVAPQCPPLLPVDTSAGGSGGGQGNTASGLKVTGLSGALTIALSVILTAFIL